MDILLDTKELAAYCKCSTRTISRALKNGELPPVAFVSSTGRTHKLWWKKDLKQFKKLIELRKKFTPNSYKN